MSDAKHTPGPWVAGRPDMATMIEGRNGKYIYAGERYIAAAGFDVRDWDETVANARLIAAAPELLEALEEMYRVCNASSDDAPHRVKARAAIAKAKGTP